MPTSGPDPRALERLRRSADFQRVQSSGRRARSSLLLIVYAPGGSAVSRVGWAVSRKVGNAVHRNRVKRWFREAVRKIPEPPAGPWDMVLIPRAEVLEAGFAVLSAQVAEVFRRVRP